MGYDLSMRVRSLSLAFVVFVTFTASAQSTHADIEARLLHQPLYLRGLWQDDHLNFDQSGALVGASATTSFTLSGIEVSKVVLKSQQLVVEGRRIGLTFKGSIPERVVLNIGKFKKPKDEVLHLEIEASPSGDYHAALNAVFSDLPGLVPILPAPWKKFARLSLVTNAVSEPVKTPEPDPNRKLRGGVEPPKVLNSPQPQFSEYAKTLRYSGKSLIYLQVDEEGMPKKVAIVEPTGLGLDEKAVSAVESYRFKPASENGRPVRVEMEVEVNFQVF